MILEFPASNEKTNEKAKFNGTFDGATWNAKPRPNLTSKSSYFCLSNFIFDGRHQ